MRGSDGSIVIVVGVLSIVLYALGLIPLYIQAWKHKGRVVGLSTNRIIPLQSLLADSFLGWLFMTTDIAGGLLSLMALAAQHTFDVLGGIGYVLVLTMELGIGVVQLVWLWRTRKIRAEATTAGMGYDEYVSEEDPHENTNEKLDGLQNTIQIKAPEKALVHGE